MKSFASCCAASTAAAIPGLSLTNAGDASSTPFTCGPPSVSYDFSTRCTPGVANS